MKLSPPAPSAPIAERSASPPAEPPRRRALASVPAAGPGDAARVADAAAASWSAIEAALAPVIGRGGVAALHKRSLHVARRAYPWLSEVPDLERSAGDYRGLQGVLARQTAAEAEAAGNAMLTAFRDSLAGLIGPSLTARLLRDVPGRHDVDDATPPP